MVTGPLPMGMYCYPSLCNPPCSRSECDCLNASNLHQCFPIFQVKFNNITHTSGGSCLECNNSITDTWNQYECLTGGDQTVPPGEVDLWDRILNTSVIDPCSGPTISKQIWVKVTQSGTTVTVDVILKLRLSTAKFRITFTVTTGHCPDNSNKTAQAMTMLSSSDDTPCTVSSSGCDFRWV